MKLSSNIKTQSTEYKEAFQHNKAMLAEFHELKHELTHPKEAVKEAQHKKNKLLARERVNLLIDSDSEFLELSEMAGYKLYEDNLPAGGIVTGVGLVEGRHCMIIANDQTVKGGTYYPITVKKHLRAQEIAEKNHLPCIYLVDSGGAFLPKQAEVFPDRDHFGRIFYNQARMSAKRIPQISSVHGFCTAGGAYIPSMSDQSVIVNKTGSIFLAGPPLVKAATGEEVSVEELGGARVHTSISGVADHFAENDEHALSQVREIIAHLGATQPVTVKLKQPKEPAYDPEELLGIIPKDLNKFFSAKEVIARLVDNSELFEFKSQYGKTLITGFAHIGGMPIGIIANNGILFSESALKGTHFIELCCQEGIPLLFLQNITGFMVGKKYEQEGIAKHGAKLVHAVANANVPKFTLLMGGSYGAGNYGMCGRAFDPDLMFMWPNSRISVMGGEQAANVLATVKESQMQKQGKKLTEEDAETIKKPIREKYSEESHAFYASARLWDDGILDPRTTRKSLSMALSMSLQHQRPQTSFGILRM